MSLRPEYFCANQNCHQRQSKWASSLKNCTRCNTAKYCNKACQKEDFTKHKYYCKTMKEYQELLSKSNRDNLCENLYNVGQMYFDYAEMYENYHAYEKSSEIFNQLLDIYPNIDQFHCYEYLTFTFLNLGQIAEAKRIGKIWLLKLISQGKSDFSVYQALELAFELIELKKINEVPPEEAFENFVQVLQTCPPNSPNCQLGYCDIPLDIIEHFLSDEVSKQRQKCFELFDTLNHDLENVVLQNETSRKTMKWFENWNYQSWHTSNLLSYCTYDALIFARVTFGFFSRHTELPKLADQYRELYDEELYGKWSSDEESDDEDFSSLW